MQPARLLRCARCIVFVLRLPGISIIIDITSNTQRFFLILKTFSSNAVEVYRPPYIDCNICPIIFSYMAADITLEKIS